MTDTQDSDKPSPETKAAVTLQDDRRDLGSQESSYHNRSLAQLTHGGDEAIAADATPLRFTRFQTNGAGVIGKRFWLAPDGVLQSHSQVALADGIAESITVAGMSGFAECLQEQPPGVAFGYGVMDRHQARIVSERRLAEHPGAITRSRKYFHWLARSAGIALVDIDAHHIAQPPGSAAELRDWLIQAMPVLEVAPMAICSSNSSFVFDSRTNEPVTAQCGWHAYIAVRDASDIPRFIDLLYSACWLAGHGNYTASTCGKLLGGI